jgi:hypothetical protein
MDNNSSVPNPDKSPTNLTNPIPTRDNRKWHKGFIAVVVLAIIAIVVLCFNNTKNNSTTVNNEGQTLSPAQQPKGEILLYAKTVTYTDTNNRRWLTETIFRRVNDGQPESLATVGKVGEYPDGFELTPDKKFLLINLESKLQILDLATKELKDLVIAKEQIRTFAFSPDRTQLFIWDQKYIGSGNYYVHIYDFATKADRIVAEGKLEGVLSSGFWNSRWRDDGKVILFMADVAPQTWYYDLQSKKFVKVTGPFQHAVLSEDGELMAMDDGDIGDICNEYSASAISTYKIIDSVTGEEIGKVGDSKKNSSVIAFSSNNQEVLYSTQLTAARREDCDKEQQESYFLYNLSQKTIAPVTNLALLLEQWGQYSKGAKISYDKSGSAKVQKISIGDKILAYFDNEEIQFIAAYKNQ